MAWKQTSHPTVQQQRDKWVVRVDGIDTVSGARKPRQLGTYRSRRAARAAASAYAASGESGAERSTVGAVVDRWVAGKVDVSNKSRLQYEWAAGHIRAGLGGVRLDRLDRDDVGRWLDDLANGGKLSRRSIQIMRMVLRAALDDAVDVGELRRNPAARVGMPRHVAKTSRELDRTAWTEDELRKFLTAIADHRWAGPLRLAALYGLRRSELLGLSWPAVDVHKPTVRIEQALIEVHGRPEWSDGKNVRSRRTIPTGSTAQPSPGEPSSTQRRQMRSPPEPESTSPTGDIGASTSSDSGEVPREPPSCIAPPIRAIPTRRERFSGAGTAHRGPNRRVHRLLATTIFVNCSTNNVGPPSGRPHISTWVSRPPEIDPRVAAEA